MTVSMRFLAAKLQRIGTFLTSPPQKKWPLAYEYLLGTAERILAEARERPKSRQSMTKMIRIVNG